jgi:transcriptional regulator GlxA family with amidase domain
MGERAEPITASCGVAITPFEPYRDPDDFDYVVVVGGLLRRREGNGNVAYDRAAANVADYLRTAAARKRVLIGLGTGTFILARAGVMDGYRSCVSWYHLNDFRCEFPQLTAVADRLYLVDRDRITCAGGIGVVDLAARLIEQHCGRSAALKSLRMILADAPRLSASPQPDPVVDRPIADPRVRQAILAIEQNLGNPPSVEALAGAVGVSARQLERAFNVETGMSVMAFSRDLRLKYAQWLLGHSEWTIAAIAQECGFADSSHFGRLFRRHIGLSPSSVRRGAASSRDQ